MEPANAIEYTKIIKYTNTNLVYLRTLVGAIIVHIANVFSFRIVLHAGCRHIIKAYTY